MRVYTSLWTKKILQLHADHERCCQLRWTLSVINWRWWSMASAEILIEHQTGSLPCDVIVLCSDWLTLYVGTPTSRELQLLRTGDTVVVRSCMLRCSSNLVRARVRLPIILSYCCRRYSYRRGRQAQRELCRHDTLVGVADVTWSSPVHCGCLAVVVDAKRRMIFTARRYASACISHHRVSVCLSVTRRYCIKTAKRRIAQTTPLGSPGTLVFWRQ